ncbi:hypothetical protein [Streptomyces sp. NPDC097619]|uniref:hypothetical protein n=1 Tax=Streptomyces sp. NPDC097619 TaxID=3157228 RepID=UPI003328D39A
MPRITKTLGTLAAAATLAIGFSGSAHAAGGTLHINGWTFHEPQGCYTVSGPAMIENRSDNPAFVFSNPYCFGPNVAVVLPGQSGFVPLQRSVYVP